VTDTVTLPPAPSVEEGEAPPFHTILEVWREVLRPAATERNKRITAQWANRIVATHVGLTYADMQDFREAYFDGIQHLADILDEVIDENPECLNVEDAEEDRVVNDMRYITVLTRWQKAILGWELDWDVTSDWAAVEIAAIDEVHRMFFDQTGLVALLDQIGFELGDDGREALSAELQEFRTAKEAG
jgi:hypothetical protein